MHVCVHRLSILDTVKAECKQMLAWIKASDLARASNQTAFMVLGAAGAPQLIPLAPSGEIQRQQPFKQRLKEINEKLVPLKLCPREPGDVAKFSRRGPSDEKLPPEFPTTLPERTLQALATMDPAYMRIRYRSVWAYF